MCILYHFGILLLVPTTEETLYKKEQNRPVGGLNRMIWIAEGTVGTENCLNKQNLIFFF